MPSDDLFGTWLSAVWTKARPEGRPPTFVMHRFLASDRDLAEAARVLQRDAPDPRVCLRIWQGLLPRGRGVPRGLRYAAPKRPPAVEALVARVMEVEDLRRELAEEAVETLAHLGRLADAHAWYGVPEEGEEP